VSLQKRIGHMTRFGIVGIVNTVLDLALFSLLIYVLEVSLFPASFLSYFLAMIFSFFANKLWTFGQSLTDRRWFAQLTYFTATNAVGLVVSVGSIAALAPALGPLPAKIVTAGAWALISFFIAQTITFSASTRNLEREPPKRS